MALKKNGEPMPSPAGKGALAVVDQTNWRQQLQLTRIKFDDEAKAVYLTHIARDGLKGNAARSAGVCLQTVRDHTENDPDFQSQVLAAIDTYRDKVVSHHQMLVFEGEVHETFDKDGNLLARKHVYPTRLVELELKKVDHSYREKQSVDLGTIAGGVMVAPPDITPAEWIKREQEKNLKRVNPEDKPIIEAEFEEVEPEGGSG